MRSACLMKLGQKKEAITQIELLLLMKPDFKEKTAYLISRFVKEDHLVEHVMDGLRKASMVLDF